MTQNFSEDFDSFDEAFWYKSDFAIDANFIATAWSPEHVVTSPGTVTLELDNEDLLGKRFTGGEIRSTETYSYGTYNVVMQPSGDRGALSSFFLYTGSAFGTPLSEIDIEFIGRDTTEVNLAMHTPAGSVSQRVDLGFDAALAEHTYTIEWAPNAVSWYADGVHLLTMDGSDVGIPAEPSHIFMSIWTGSNDFTGRPALQDGEVTEATYSAVSFEASTAPVAFADDARTDAGQPVTIDVLQNDSATIGTLLRETMVIVDQPANGSAEIDPETGDITYAPDAGFKGVDSFTYSVSNGQEASNPATVEVVVGKAVFEDFSDGPGAFTYVDDPFRSTDQPDFADGLVERGAMRTFLGGPGSATVEDISGGWTTTFDSQEGQTGTLTLSYRIRLDGSFDQGEYGEVIYAIDGVAHVLDTMAATDKNSERLDTGFVTVTLDIGPLDAGTHTLTLGGYINQRNGKRETAVVMFDDVDLELSSDANPADADGNLALVVPDLQIDPIERGAVTFGVTGLDSGVAGALIVSDGSTSQTVAVATDGDVVVDLSDFDFGQVTTSLTATHPSGAIATVTGPELTLIRPSADDGGDLQLTVADTTITDDEDLAVVFGISGLDPDAAAQLIITNGDDTRQVPVVQNGDVALDLSDLPDGSYATSLLATKPDAEPVTVSGPALTFGAAETATVDFSDETQALSIDMAAGTYSQAARVLLLGDDLTIGWSSATDDATQASRELQDGFRGHLMNGLLADGAWIDYVGGFSSGSSLLLDGDHSAVASEKLRRIANSNSNEASVQLNVQAHDPDIALLLAGRNDIGGNQGRFLDKNFPAIIDGIETAVARYFQNAQADAHLVISTLPDLLDGKRDDFAAMVNEGYSLVDGEPVAGDAGNGTYRPGIVATVTELQQSHANLHLNMVDWQLSDIGADGLRLTDTAYADFAETLQTLIQDEIGLSGGTIAGTAEALPATTSVIGGAGGDHISGAATADTIVGNEGNDALFGRGGNDTIDGGAGNDRIVGGTGADVLTGGADADQFVFNASQSGSTFTDQITDFGDGADLIVLSAALAGGATVSDISAGVEVLFANGDRLQVDGLAAEALKGAALGGDQWALTEDNSLIIVLPDTDLIFG